MENKDYNLFINHKTQELMILVTPFASEVKLKFNQYDNQLIVTNEMTGTQYCLENIPLHAWQYLQKKQGFMAEIGQGQVLGEYAINLS